MHKENFLNKDFDWKCYRRKSDTAYRKAYLTGNKELVKPHNIIKNGGIELNFALDLAKLYFGTTPAKGKALDVGCGGGYMTSCLKEFGFEAVGFDISEEAIALAKKSFPEITYFVGNGVTPKEYFNRPQFDLIFLREFHPFTRIDSFDDQRKIIEDYLDILNENGIVIISHSRRIIIQGRKSNTLDYRKVKRYFQRSTIQTAGPIYFGLHKKLRISPKYKMVTKILSILTGIVSSVIVYPRTGGGLIEFFLIYKSVG